MHAVENHRDPERPLSAARLRDEHPPDRQRLERLTEILHPADQFCFGLRGEHHLAVHSCGQTTRVALG
ncbi:MAG TPA: hypothetical protein VFJ24_07500, partial [Gaiellales bacterium]|nr:hypothetical protein [Gaiellales bacterium]